MLNTRILDKKMSYTENAGYDETLNIQELSIIHELRRISPKNRTVILDLIKVLSKSSEV